MPLCYVYTNVSDKELKEGIEERIAMGIADILKKPLERVVVVVVPGVRVFRMGNTEPACAVNISSIGVFDSERNPGYSDRMRDIFMTEMSLTSDRITIVYDDLDKTMLG